MGNKRKHRQPDVTDEASLHSSESGEDTNTGGPKCDHIMKSINMKKFRVALKKNGINTECSTCQSTASEKIEEDDDGFGPMSQPLWICLQCGNQSCGRSQSKHAELHFKTPHSDSHCLAIDSCDWRIWCYKCDYEVKADSKKQLLEIVEYIKKLATTSYTPSQPAIPLPPIEKPPEYGVILSPTKEKPKVLTNLTRVGGLTNLGNTCFFNSVMQCLAQTPFLVKVLEDLEKPGEKIVLPGGKYKISEDAEENELPPIEGTLEGWGSFTSILHKTLIEMQNSEGNQTYKPSELLNSFKKKNSQCMDGGQHDSHELLRHLLELVRNEDLRRYQSIILNKILGENREKNSSIDDIKKSQVKFYGNQASARFLGPEPVFRGVLVSTLECCDCGHSSQRTEPFLDLSLPVMAEKPQPPILKRKNSGLDDNFDLGGNNITSVPSKHQLKKEQRNARKNRKNRRAGNNINNNNITYPSGGNNVGSNESEGSGAESEESDADIEDNVEGEGRNPVPEVIESGYSSEKVSSIASPISPTELIETVALDPTDKDNLLINGNVFEMVPARHCKVIEEVIKSDSLNNLHGDTNKISDTSLKIPLDQIPRPDRSIPWFEDGTFNPNAPNLCREKSPLNGLNISKETFSGAETDECHSISDVENQLKNTRNAEKCNLNLTYNEKTSKLENGIGEITSAISKVSVSTSSQQSPKRYDIKDGDCSIQSCLNQFTQLELMKGSNKVGCEACTAAENKGKEGKMVCTPSTKQYLISKVPAVLILHLKRFQSQRLCFRKVNKHVAFPMILDLAPVCKYHDKPKIYALYGLVEHSGTMHGGHYVAYVKARKPIDPSDPRWAFLPKKGANETEENSSTTDSDSEGNEASGSTKPEPPPGRWYYVSDSRVMEVDENKVLQQEAYLLFYERIQ